MADYNYARCDDPLCPMCEGYSAGYVDGKAKGTVRGLYTDCWPRDQLRM